MKRFNPVVRKQIIRDMGSKLANDFLCRYGGWNRNKLLLELSKHLKNIVKELENNV